MTAADLLAYVTATRHDPDRVLVNVADRLAELASREAAIERLIVELDAVDSPRLGRESYQEGREDLADLVSQRLKAILAGRDDGPAIPPVWPVPLTRDEARALLAEGKRIADQRRKAREARERDPERAR